MRRQASRRLDVRTSRQRRARPEARTPTAFTWRLTAEQGITLDTMMFRLKRELGRPKLDRFRDARRARRPGRRQPRSIRRPHCTDANRADVMDVSTPWRQVGLACGVTGSRLAPGPRPRSAASPASGQPAPDSPRLELGRRRRGPGGRLGRRGPGGEPRRGAGCGTAAEHRPGRTIRPAVSGSTRRGSRPLTYTRAGGRPAHSRSRAGHHGVTSPRRKTAGPGAANAQRRPAGAHGHALA